MSLSTSSTLLILYLSCETVRANYAYYAFRTFPQISASLVTLLSEIFKLSVAVTFLSRSNGGFSLSTLQKHIKAAQSGEYDLKQKLKYAVPAALYLINNLIYYTALPLTTPSLLQVCVLAKLPATALLHHFMIKPQRNVYAWTSLSILCIGLAVFNIPSTTPQSPNTERSAWYLAPIAGLIIACLSALASISTETSTKIGGFWESQACLYLWGIVFSAISYPLLPSRAASDMNPHAANPVALILTILGLAVVTGGSGLAVGVMLRARDNILKLIGTAASLVTVVICQYLLSPDLRATTFTTWKVCGGGILVTSTWCFNHYCQEPWPPREGNFKAVPETDIDSEACDTIDEELLSQEGEGKTDSSSHEVTESVMNESLRPNATKIASCLVVTAFITMEVAKRS